MDNRMCGICGVLSQKKISRRNLIEMNNTISHRGPDDSGEEIYELTNGWSLGLAHRRLSIVDLSLNGHQPMHSLNGRVSIVFNGEIYNYRELRTFLSGYTFTSNTDTEVILAAYMKWGSSFVEHIEGMFAIAILDRNDDSIYLIRDRIGKKPLYYYWNSETCIFASELKAICSCNMFEKKINKTIVGRYLYRSYITSPETIYIDTYKLEPGTILKIKNGGITKQKYWDVAEQHQKLKKLQVDNYIEAKSVLENLITLSVKRRLVADVPVGALLSGGYDSSLVCAIAQGELDSPLRTFSIGFGDSDYDEAPFAKTIAEYLGTEHTELYVTESDFISVIDSIPLYYDEPFSDSSQIPTMLVAQLARQKVTVALTGDGGDELFGGYGIYNILQKVQSIDEGIEKAPNTGSIIDRIYESNTDNTCRTQGGVDTYINAINSILLEKVNNFYYPVEHKYNESRYDIRRMLLDVETSLPEDMLTKVDRASMRYALECRCPLLDKDVVEYSFRLSPDFKNFKGNTKRIIKDITYKYIPQSMMDRPKKGFCIPQDKWLRTLLKERITDYTEKDYLRRQGIFNPEITIKFIDDYMRSGDQGKWSGHNYSKVVWSYFIFQQWYDCFFKPEISK